jgi:acyl carrier protein
MNDTQEEIIELIKTIINSNEDLEPKMKVKDISLETSFQNDLGFDSLGIMSITYELQDKYTSLNEENMINWKTIKDLVQDILNG